jgi:hypothetical protein
MTKIEAGKANYFRKYDQGIVWFNNRIVVPKNDEVRQQILDETHLSRYSIHPESTKMYHDLVGTCSLLQGDPTGVNGDVNRVLAQDGNSSVNLASQGHCAGVFIGI